jgi:hypothetical protein
MQRQLGSSERTHYCSSIRDHLLVGQASVIETSGDQTAGFEMAGSSLVQQLEGRNVVEVSRSGALFRITPSPDKYLSLSTYLNCAVHKRFWRLSFSLPGTHPPRLQNGGETLRHKT